MLGKLFKKKEKRQKSSDLYMTLKVAEVIQETPQAVSLAFDNPNGESYLSGQFLTVIVDVDGKEYRRCYSLCSSPEVDDRLVITIKRVLDGKVSNYIADKVKAGQDMRLMKAMGTFTVTPDPANKRHIVLFGGGSGITPLMSIAKTILAKEPESIVSLLYANTDQESIIFNDKLNELQQQYGDRFIIQHTLEKTPEAWTEWEGRIDVDKVQSFLDKHDNGLERSYYICGPAPMMEVVEASLSHLGIDKNIHKESFVTPPSEAQSLDPNQVGDKKGHEVTIIYGGEEHKINVPPGKFILETAQKNGIDIPFSCQSGLCTACMGKCLSGEVAFETDALTDADREEGYVLTCVGKPVTDDVIIEIE